MSAPIPPSAPTPPPARPTGLDLSDWSIFDKIALGAGAVLFVFSFFSSFVTASVDVSGFSASSGISAWNSYATLGLLLCFAAVALVVVQRMESSVLPDTVPWPLITAGSAGLGLLLLVIRAFTYGGDVPSGVGVSVHPGWSGWIVMAAGLVILAATAIPLTSYRGTVEARLNNIGGGSTPSA